MQVVKRLVCDQCSHEYDACLRRDADGYPVYSNENERLANTRCNKRFSFTEPCSGVLELQRSATFVMCGRCHAEYDHASLGKKCTVIKHVERSVTEIENDFFEKKTVERKEFFRCGGKIITGRRRPIVKCSECRAIYTVTSGSDGAECVCMSNSDSPKFKEPAFASILRKVPHPQAGRVVFSHYLDDELEYGPDGSGIIPAKYLFQTQLGSVEVVRNGKHVTLNRMFPTAAERENAIRLGLPMEMLDPLIECRNDTRGLAKAVSTCVELVGTPCRRETHKVGRCTGLVRAIPITVKLTDVKSYDPRTIDRGVHFLPEEKFNVVESSDSSGKGERDGTSGAADQVSAS